MSGYYFYQIMNLIFHNWFNLGHTEPPHFDDIFNKGQRRQYNDKFMRSYLDENH